MPRPVSACEGCGLNYWKSALDTHHTASGLRVCIIVALLRVPSYKMGTEIPILSGGSQNSVKDQSRLDTQYPISKCQLQFPGQGKLTGIGRFQTESLCPAWAVLLLGSCREPGKERAFLFQTETKSLGRKVLQVAEG